MKRKWNVEYIRKYMDGIGCKLLSTEYDSHTPIEYVAQCGHVHKTIFNNIRNGRCLVCPKCSGYSKHTIDEIRELFKSRGCTLLTEKYERAHGRLDYIASCGHVATTTYSDFARRDTCMCKKCEMKLSGEKRRLETEEILKRFESVGCHVLSIDSATTHGKVRYIAQCGHEETIILGNFLNGRGRICKECNGNPGCSGEEHEMAEFVRSIYDGVVIEHHRMDGKEIDIYVPDLSLGIEYDGLRWHGEGFHRDRLNLLHKTEFFQERGIQMLHFYDVEWRKKKDIVKSMIENRIGKTPVSYYARNLKFAEVPFAEKTRFLEKNHIQGSDTSKYAVGLYSGERLVSLMTFGRRKITGGRTKFELLRFCNETGTTVVGGASRLLAGFSRMHPELSGVELVTYANRRYSTGGMYGKLGFEKKGMSSPCYYYFKGDGLFHRTKFQKHKLKSALSKYDGSLTEWDNMRANGYDRIFDCGNIVYSKTL